MVHFHCLSVQPGSFKMSVCRRLAFIMPVLLVFAEGFLFTVALSSSSIINSKGIKQLYPAMRETHGVITKANLSKRSSTHFGNFSNYFQGKYLSTCKSCGLINSNRKNFLIIKGDTVDPPYKYPFMVQIDQDWKGYGSFHHCGGAIISEYYILTAAHCIEENSGEDSRYTFLHPKQITVKFMTATYETKSGPEVEKIIPHPKYDPSTTLHDIALLKLKNKIICDKFKNPICLPPPGMRFDYGKLVQAIGWGKTESGDVADKLQEGTMKHLAYVRCKQPSILKDTHYCFEGLQKNFPSPCSGDSGGPVFFENNGKYYLIGVMSRSNCRDVLLGTAVPKYIKWINEVTM